ncbi:MAG: exodeoxyribonuclease VII large subunit [Verrucomicrobia bacterium]|nr:exodeoxyribonuclease VII large subunit [Verrucomicrobiota bacterium]
MSRPAKSQWNFGELFEPAATRKVYSVTEITSTVRRLLEQHVGSVWVAGEITNLREQSSGHIYFSLKDAAAQLQCVCFRSDARESRHLLQDGQKVLLQGDVTVYEARGQYQLIVRAVEAQGVGALQLAFEKLKQKLNAEGLFAPERKRPLPRFPQRIGIVTSPTGAALRDVIHVVGRRQPSLGLVLAPARVQGQGAADEIAAAIGLLNAWSAASERERLDLILVTRGGGSLEDLWAFNEEVVARAIFNSRLPVVSAVGHEIDFTISDFVADLRAATPSAAAEIITETAFASRQALAETQTHLRRLAQEWLAEAGAEIARLVQRLTRLHPRRQLQEQEQRLDDFRSALVRAARQGWRGQRMAWEHAAQRLVLARPSHVIARRVEALAVVQRRLRESARRGFDLQRQSHSKADLRLRLLSPMNVLERGYSITSDEATGQVVRDARQVQLGQRLKTRVREGEIRSVVERATPKSQ